MTDSIAVRLTPAVLVAIIADSGCLNFTAPSDCIRSGRHPLAKYGADQMCEGCMAKLAQQSDDS